MICTLEKSINSCPFYKAEEGKCSNANNNCAYRVIEGSSSKYDKKQYVRKPRWYEVYYK